MLFFKVTHPDFSTWPRTLVGGRRKGLEPLCVVTNEPVENAEDAWNVVYAQVAHRTAFPASQKRQNYREHARLQLPGLLTLASGLLMDLMREQLRRPRDWLRRFVCPRRSQRMREIDIPLSRVRLTLSRIWLACPCWFVRQEPDRQDDRPLAPFPDQSRSGTMAGVRAAPLHCKGRPLRLAPLATGSGLLRLPSPFRPGLFRGLNKRSKLSSGWMPSRDNQARYAVCLVRYRYQGRWYRYRN